MPSTFNKFSAAQLTAYLVKQYGPGYEARIAGRGKKIIAYKLNDAERNAAWAGLGPVALAEAPEHTFSGAFSTWGAVMADANDVFGWGAQQDRKDGVVAAVAIPPMVAEVADQPFGEGDLVRVKKSGKVYQVTRTYNTGMRNGQPEFRQVRGGKLYGPDFIRLKAENIERIAPPMSEVHPIVVAGETLMPMVEPNALVGDLMESDEPVEVSVTVQAHTRRSIKKAMRAARAALRVQQAAYLGGDVQVARGTMLALFAAALDAERAYAEVKAAGKGRRAKGGK